MNNKKTTTRTKVANEVVTFKKYTKLQTNKDFLKGSNYVLIAKGNTKEWDAIRNLGMLIAQSYEYFKTEQCKKELKKCGYDDLTANEFFRDEFGYEKTQFYNYNKIGKIDKEKFDEYVKENKVPNVRNIVKAFSNKADDTTTKKDKPNYLKISVTKDEKFTINGIASKNVYALLIDELRKRYLELEKLESKTKKVAKTKKVVNAKTVEYSPKDKAFVPVNEAEALAC